MGHNSFNKLNPHSTDVIPFSEILLLPMPFYFLSTNIMRLPPLLLQYVLLLCYCIFCCLSLVQFTLDVELIKSCWMDLDGPNPTGHLFQECLSKPSLSWRTKLWHYMGIFAIRFHLHFAVQAGRASTSVTEGSMSSHRDAKCTTCSAQWWENNSWFTGEPYGNTW